MNSYLQIFVGFLDEMINNFTDEEKNNMVIIMDNTLLHTTNEVIHFYKIKKFKGLTIYPYRSYLNKLELVFRAV